MKSLLLCGVTTLIVVVAGSAHISAETVSPPVIRLEEVSTPPVIDGILDDACWQGRTVLAGFRENAHGTDATEPTEVMLVRDMDGLYVAFRCHDSQPSKIRAEQRSRNASQWADDSVTVYLDASHTHTYCYSFTVNPAGAQTEEIPSGAASNITWRGDWRASAEIGPDGWSAEMVIPFRFLKYPSDSASLGLALERRIARLDETSRWPDMGRAFDLTMAADLIDLTLPNRGSRSVLMPYTVSSTQSGRMFTVFGMDWKLDLENDVTMMATYNPDFTDVQNAVAPIAFSYTERRLPEERPFFQEGSGFFPDSAAFYSRRIGDMDFGAKGFGTLGRHTFGFLNAVRFGAENHFASLYSYDPSCDAGFSVYFTGSSVEDVFKADSSEPDSSLCLAPGFFIRKRAKSGNSTLSVRRYTSVNSSGPRRGSSLLGFLGKDATSERLGYSLYYLETSSDFYVRDGYTPLTGIRGGGTTINYGKRLADGRLLRWNASVGAHRNWAEGNSIHDDGVSVDIAVETRKEWAFGLSVDRGTWLGKEDSTIGFNLGWLARHFCGGGRFSFDVGKRDSFDYIETNISQSFAVSDRLNLGLAVAWNRLDAFPAADIKRQIVLSGDCEVSPERKISFWAVGKESDLNLCLTYSQATRSGSDVYLIYGFPNESRTQHRIALKIIRPTTF